MKGDRTRPRPEVREIVLFSAIAMGCVTALGPGCGGNDSSPLGISDSGPDGITPGSDSGSDASEDTGEDAGLESGNDVGVDSSADSGVETGADTGVDAGIDTGVDAGTDASDASAACSPAGSACTATGVTAGLCVNTSCSLCSDPSDNTNCTSAYGGGTTHYICNASGACVQGNCETDVDCTTSGQICGVTTANTCGPCTADTQCQTDPTYGPGTICNTTTGACVASTCVTANAACVNPSDFCCPSGAAASNACVPGNCCANADCAAGAPICGGGGPNVCGKCTLDSQCAANQVCDTTTGQCASNACTGPGVTGGVPAACAPNPNDMCCLVTCTPNPAKGTTAVACCPGTAGDTFCKGPTGLNNTSATCSSGDVCTTCGAVSLTAPVYIVDPVNGSDSGTGSAAGADGGVQESCALKTVTRALQLISVVGTALSTKVIIVGGTNVIVGANESFPLIIPTNVTVTTQTGAVTVQVPNGKAGFVLNSPNSSILSGGPSELLTITTTVNSAVTPPTGGTNGIQVTGSATAASTTISNVTVTGMLDDGILVEKGAIMIGAGVVSSNNGVTKAARAGLHVTGTGAATINVQFGGTPTAFMNNTAHGILVDSKGSVNLSGVVTSASVGTGTVTTNGNVAAGVWIQQTPGGTLPRNVISGLVSFANTGGNGMRIVAGSNVQLRDSVLLDNQANGIIISTSGKGAGANNDISNIDLGSGASNGGNTFQAAFAGGSHNGGVGICLAVAASGTHLSALGNQFSAANCATTAATLSLNKNNCANNRQACPSGVCDLGLQGGGGTANVFDVSMCTQ